jgi:hypothetical protein
MREFRRLSLDHLWVVVQRREHEVEPPAPPSRSSGSTPASVIEGRELRKNLAHVRPARHGGQ